MDVDLIGDVVMADELVPTSPLHALVDGRGELRVR